MSDPKPRRAEIWTAELGDGKKHWVVIVSLDARNASERADSVLVVPFGSAGVESVTSLKLEPGETGLAAPSYLKCHFIQTIRKARLIERQPRSLSARRMKEVALAMRCAFDPDALWSAGNGR